jgi:hypothetical protein
LGGVHNCIGGDVADIMHLAMVGALLITCRADTFVGMFLTTCMIIGKTITICMHVTGVVYQSRRKMSTAYLGG